MPWNERAQEIWHGDISNYLDAIQEGTYRWGAGNFGDGNWAANVEPDSAFSAAYADWQDAGGERHGEAYFDFLVELGVVDADDEEAHDRYTRE